jgi:chromosome partitioning protein
MLTDMKVLTILSQKGGTGKTTIALHLAVAATQANQNTIIVDLDPQASASQWHDARNQKTPQVVSVQSALLSVILEAARSEGSQLAIIDTAPHSEGAALAAARLADFILIPCRPAILDLHAIRNSVDIVRIANKRGAVVLNAVPAKSRLTEEAIEAVKAYSIEVSPIQVGQRAAFVHSLTSGLVAHEYEPNGKAAEEILQLYNWTCIQLGMLT